MATSGSSDFSLNRNEIITRAYTKLGVGNVGEALSNDEVVAGDINLNLMVKSWQIDVDLWIKTRGTLVAVAAQESYTMGPSGNFTTRPLRILDMQFSQTSGDIPMNEYTRQEYYELSLKSSAGTPTNFYYDPQLTTGTLFVWPVLGTGVSGSFKFTYARSVEDFDTSTDDADLPQEWLLAMVYGLAVLLSDEYGGLTENIVRMAASLKANLQMWDEEGGSVFLQPE